MTHPGGTHDLGLGDTFVPVTGGGDATPQAPIFDPLGENRFGLPSLEELLNPDGGTPTFDELIASGDWVLIPGRPGVFIRKDGAIIDTNAPTTGTGRTGPTGAELDIDRRYNDLIARGQDIELQIANADRELQAAQLELARLTEQHRVEVARGTLDLAKVTEARIREFAQKTLELQQQMFALDQQRVAVNAQIDAANAFGTLGADLGQLEFQRDELLLETLANPRDFAELALQQGGGFDFISQLAGEEPVTGRSSRLIGERTLGPAFADALSSIMQRPELDFFSQAADRLSGIPGFDALLGQQPATEAPPAAPGKKQDALGILSSSTPQPPQANVRDAQLAAQQGDTATAEEIARRVLQGV